MSKTPIVMMIQNVYGNTNRKQKFQSRIYNIARGSIKINVAPDDMYMILIALSTLSGKKSNSIPELQKNIVNSLTKEFKPVNSSLSFPKDTKFVLKIICALDAAGALNKYPKLSSFARRMCTLTHRATG